MKTLSIKKSISCINKHMHLQLPLLFVTFALCLALLYLFLPFFTFFYIRLA